jgi:hypothetical protein
MEAATDSSQNVEMFKIKKLIKGLEAARGYHHILKLSLLTAAL